MKDEVLTAIDEIRKTFSGHEVRVDPDSDGGAFVTVDSILLGEKYSPSKSGIGFHITFQYPHADVYPHFILANLVRTDGKQLSAGFKSGREWKPGDTGHSATMISRRSPRLNPEIDTATTKLQKVIQWVTDQ